MLDARSKERFPNLGKPFCPWHEDCTAMDCENFRTIPETPEFGPPIFGPTLAHWLKDVQSLNQSVPIKPSKKGKKK